MHYILYVVVSRVVLLMHLSTIVFTSLMGSHKRRLVCKQIIHENSCNNMTFLFVQTAIVDKCCNNYLSLPYSWYNYVSNVL